MNPNLNLMMYKNIIIYFLCFLTYFSSFSFELQAKNCVLHDTLTIPLHNTTELNNTLVSGIGIVVGDATLGRAAIQTMLGYAHRISSLNEIEFAFSTANWSYMERSPSQYVNMLAQSSFHAGMDVSLRTSIQSVAKLSWIVGATVRWHNMASITDYTATLPTNFLRSANRYSQGYMLGVHGKLDYTLTLLSSADCVLRGQFYVMPWSLHVFPDELPRPDYRFPGVSASISCILRMGF